MNNFWSKKKVFITGHTGFKGSWLCRVLLSLGAEITGYSLTLPTEPSLFEICGLKKEINSIISDIRDLKSLSAAINSAQPEVVLHLAAQPIVRDSYANPVYTYETNVMGTVNILEAVRHCGSVRSVLNITTDKVYKNLEWCWGYRENDELNGYDPYSNSKSCSELVTGSYINSFFREVKLPVSTARAGNVIGGGDFSNDRIIPDCVRSAIAKKDIVVRNPYSVRPYQHVLEPLYAYLTVAEKQYEDYSFAGNYNIGPNDSDCVETGNLTQLFCDAWGDGIRWVNQHDGGPHESGFLKLDCSLARSVFGWSPKWKIDAAVAKTVEWTKAYYNNEDINAVMDKQIEAYGTGVEGLNK